MEQSVLDSSSQGVDLAQLALLSAMMAGAVAGAVAGWLSKRNIGLSLCTFMIGIMGGLLIGTGMGRWIYVSANGADTVVKAGVCSLCSASVAGLAGSIPTALLIPSLVIFITLRHVRNRPPRVKTGLQAAVAGVITGTLTAITLLIV